MGISGLHMVMGRWGGGRVIAPSTQDMLVIVPENGTKCKMPTSPLRLVDPERAPENLLAMGNACVEVAGHHQYPMELPCTMHNIPSSAICKPYYEIRD